MVFSYNWLQSFFKQKLPPAQKLAEFLRAHLAEVEEIKKEGGDFVLDIDIRPNRGTDCFSHMGIAREIAAIMNFKKWGPENFRLVEYKKLRVKDFIRVEIKSKEDCYRYTARALVGVVVAPSPKWIQEKLRVCGLRPINNIVDAVNYVMLETGQPLHAFDLQKLEGKKLIVRFAGTGEEVVTLDGKRYELDRDILVIADEKKPVAIAGIKGGKDAEIDEKTKIIIIESANFNSRTIREGARKTGLKTDASWRFEHGIDPNLTDFAINRVADLVKKTAGGKIVKGLIDIYPRKIFPKKIQLDLKYLKSLLGIKISQKETVDILKRLGFGYAESAGRLTVEVPTLRPDISLQEDLIEEIGRIYGYEKIPSIFPSAVLIPPKRNEEIFWQDISKNILKESGFTEVYNYSFIGEKDKNTFGLKEKNLIEVKNPISDEQKYLRPTLLPNLLKNIQKNQKEFKEIRIFELGKVFQSPKLEKRMLAGAITLDGFYLAKGAVDSLLEGLGISDIFYDQFQATSEDSEPLIWHSKKCAEIKIGNQEVGFVGEISFKVLQDLKISQNVCVFDINFDKLLKLTSEEHEFRPISRYPSAVRDLAVLVPSGVLVEEILNKIEITGGRLVRDVDLFDIYEGEELPERKKSLAFHIIYQSEDRTLKAEEIENIHQKIIKSLEDNPDWEVRR